MMGLLVLTAMLGTAFVIVDNQDDDDAAASREPEMDDAIRLQEDGGTFEGSSEAERVLGGSGSDLIRGGGGNDTLSGGAGDEDFLYGDNGDDTIYGGDGTDRAFGGNGDDRVFLGSGDDFYLGEDRGELDENAGDDFVRGGAGDDLLNDSSGSNILFGDTGNDYLVAVDDGAADDRHSSDTLNGGTGEDTLIGDDRDVLTGGSGADLFSVHHAYDDEQGAVTIEDFDTAEDALIFSLQSTSLASDPETAEAPAAEFNEETGEIIVSGGGEILAILRGMSLEDLDNLTFSVLSS